MFLVRHEDVFIARSNRSQSSGSKARDMESNNIRGTNTQTGTNYVWILSWLSFIVLPNTRDRKVFHQAFNSGNLCLLCVQGKGEIKCASPCLLVSKHEDEKSPKDGWPTLKAPLCLGPNNMMSRVDLNADNQGHPPPNWRAPGLLKVILQSIRKIETGLESMLPAQLGTRLDMPGGFIFTEPQSSQSNSNSLARSDSIPSG